MSQEDIENLRAYFDRSSWGKLWRPKERPFAGMDKSRLDPDVTFEATSLPDEVGETFRGHDRFIQAGERYIEPFEWMVIEVEEIIDAGDRVVSIHRVRVKAQHTGIEFDYPAAYVWTFRAGNIFHVRGYLDPKQALKAVGTEE